MPGNVNASPSKLFFVEMLVRDIELDDAILDLLDNCVDGIVRTLQHNTDPIASDEYPYEGYWAKIRATEEEFIIEDNCGGIPRGVAINYAFRLGRSVNGEDNDVPTVGIYGIGMKRALFKLGNRSSIKSKHKDESYEVKITPEWLRDEDDWKLDLVDCPTDLPSDGTRITVTNLKDVVKTSFNSEKSNFLNGLSRKISQIFSQIIEKGFTVTLNDNVIERAKLGILSPDKFTNSEAIQPYSYKATIDGVHINLSVGFYNELASEGDDEDYGVTPRAEENAGWTIICNDRVILYHDKTHVTGWGIGSVPRYHPQFRAISGVVEFHSSDPSKLPLTTTKRGLDQGTLVYGKALKYMMEGMKKFTDFTNHWKGKESQANKEFDKLTSKEAVGIPSSIPNQMWKNVRGGEPSERKFTPNLPKPPSEQLNKRIIFYRPKDEVEFLANYFFEDRNARAAKVGEECFIQQLKKAKGEE